MGYSTIFVGEIRFKYDVTADVLRIIKSMLGEDCRKHPEWGREDLTYIDLVFNDDFTGLKWNDNTEKTYNLIDKVNLIVGVVRKAGYEDFGFTGNMLAQGEDIDDRWMLSINDSGSAVECSIDSEHLETCIKCPHCKEKFIYTHE